MYFFFFFQLKDILFFDYSFTSRKLSASGTTIKWTVNFLVLALHAYFYLYSLFILKFFSFPVLFNSSVLPLQIFIWVLEEFLKLVF